MPHIIRTQKCNLNIYRALRWRKMFKEKSYGYARTEYVPWKMISQNSVLLCGNGVLLSAIRFHLKNVLQNGFYFLIKYSLIWRP